MQYNGVVTQVKTNQQEVWAVCAQATVAVEYNLLLMGISFTYGQSEAALLKLFS